MAKRYKFESTAYGGSLYKSRKGRARPRPISTGQSMHLVLRAAASAGPKPLHRGGNEKRVGKILEKFSARHRVEIWRKVIHLNHIHLQVMVPTRAAYEKFIRAISAAIAMAVTGVSRWKKRAAKFWQHRPFSRVLVGRRAEAVLRNYLRINELEVFGCSREQARFYAAMEQAEREDRKHPRPG